jgi:hypothetical protein
MSFLSLEDKYNHLKSLIKLAKIDGNFSLSELSYIVWAAQKMEVSMGELQSLIADRENYNFDISEEAKISQLHQLLSLIHLDTTVHDDEIKYIQEIIDQMGFNSYSKKLLDYYTRKSVENLELNEFKNLLIN